MKKILAFTLVLVLSLGVLVACKTEKDPDDNADKNNDKNGSKVDASHYGNNLVDVDILEYILSDYVTLGQYKGITYTPTSTEVTEKDRQDALDQLRNLPVADKTHIVKSGDTLVIDYVGTIDGVAFDGGTATEQNLEIGSNSFIAGFESGLIGAHVGDTVVLDLKFPDDYHSAAMKGKECQFTVVIQKVYQYLEVTDDFIKEKTDYDTVEAYMEYLNTKIKEEKENYAFYTDFDQIWSEIKKTTTVKTAPEETITNYYSVKIGNFELAAENYGVDVEQYAQYYTYYTYGQAMDYNSYKNYLLSESQTLMKEVFIMYSIAAKENILITTKEYYAYLDKMIASAEKPMYKTAKELDSKMSDTYRSYLVTNDLLIPKIMKYIIENSVVVAK